jgi:uncharacterized repeat protein (TIGR03803 family)
VAKNRSFYRISSAILSFALQVSVVIGAARTAGAASDPGASLFGFGINQGGSFFCYPLFYPAILAQGRDGKLYSTATDCDTNRFGAVFNMSTFGTSDFLHYFDGADGSTSNSGLTLGTDGNFYGTATKGGADNFGTIFRVTSSGSLTTLHSFTNGADGASPYGPPVEGADGNFYGTTSAGTAYKITSSGTFTSLGAIPGGSYAPLLLGADGYFYGTTFDGGTGGLGTVFKMPPRGGATIIYSFDNTHGANPFAAVIQANDGNFYGTASAGGALKGGVVFKLTPRGAISVLHNFDPDNLLDGYGPTAALVQATDGNFYGAAAEGGPGDGILFEVTSSGSYSFVSYFGTSQIDPQSSLMQHTNGQIYGMLPGGAVYGLDVGLAPFIKTLPITGRVGKALGILGEGFTGATSVKFNGTTASFTVVSDTYISTSVPAGVTTGFVTVASPAGALKSNLKFRVTPQILSFLPTSGPTGTSVVITGDSFLGATEVTFPCGKKATFTVDSDTQITATVPVGAMTGEIGVYTPGGNVGSSTVFTVTP